MIASFPLKKSINPSAIYLYLVVVLGLSSCAKDQLNDISGDVVLKQSLSMSLGSKDMSISAPMVADTSSVPGSFGSYYYNGLPYSCQKPIFEPIYEEVPFNLTENQKSESIKKITFQVAVENNYPSGAVLEIYVIDGDGKVLDQVFGKSGMTYTEAQTDSKGNVTIPAKKITAIVYEGDRLKVLMTAKYLIYQTTIQEIFFEKTVRLSDANKFKVDIGVQAEIERKAN